MNSKLNSVSYTNEVEYWERVEIVGHEIFLFDDFLSIKEVYELTFVSKCGIIIHSIKREDRNISYKIMSFISNPSSEFLDMLANSMLFDRESNAKIWFSCYKYALENNLNQFCNKYNDVIGPKYFSITFGATND